MRHVFRHFAEQTRARDEALQRIERRLVPEIAPPEEVRARLIAVPTATPEAEARVLERLAHRSNRSSPARIVTLGTLLAAAVVLWVVRPVQVPLNGALSAPEWRTLQPTPLVALSFQGEGALGGTESAPDIEWRAGVLRVEVEPNKGVKLDVRTREALVRVVGTGFSVDRSALGTTVAVTHGRVSVECTGGASAMLGAGESTVCLPTTAAALLGRARALSEAGAAPSDVLEAVDLGLAATPGDSVREELDIARMEALAADGRWSEAWTSATRSLATDAGGRHEDLLHLRARYGLAANGCSGAVGDLGALYADGRASSVELVALSDCVMTSDPALAHGALVAALDRAVSDDDRSRISARLSSGGR